MYLGVYGVKGEGSFIEHQNGNTMPFFTEQIGRIRDSPFNSARKIKT